MDVHCCFLFKHFQKMYCTSFQRVSISVSVFLKYHKHVHTIDTKLSRAFSRSDEHIHTHLLTFNIFIPCPSFFVDQLVHDWL